MSENTGWDITTTPPAYALLFSTYKEADKHYWVGVDYEGNIVYNTDHSLESNLLRNIAVQSLENKAILLYMLEAERVKEEQHV